MLITAHQRADAAGLELLLQPAPDGRADFPAAARAGPPAMDDADDPHALGGLGQQFVCYAR